MTGGGECASQDPEPGDNMRLLTVGGVRVRVISHCTVAWSPSRALSESKGQATLCVQSAQYRTRSSENAFLRTVLVWLSMCIPYQLNIVSNYAITQYRTNASDIAHLVRIVCSSLNPSPAGGGGAKGPPLPVVFRK